MTVQPPDPPAVDLDWDRIVAWRPRLTVADFEAGRWAGGEEHTPGVLTMPWVDYTDDVLDFIHQLYELQVVAPFDWGAWVEKRGNELWEDPQRLAAVSLEECRMLLTAHVRADRFTEGHLLDAFNNGHIVAILERVKSLIHEDQT